MKHLIYISFLLLVFSSCKKEEKKYSVTYKIIEISNNTPTYIVRYTLNNGATQSLGNITANSWTSGTLSDYKAGSVLNLEVEGSGGGTYEMYILVNGTNDGYRIADDSNGAQSLEVVLPN